jgi:enediyne biosynthesis protein E4
MKKLFLAGWVCLFLINSSYGQFDTLRHYNPSQITNFSFAQARQMSRFYTFKPLIIHGFRVLMDGDTGTIECHLFGHSGADWLEFLINDMIPKFYLHKTVQGKAYVNIVLDNPVNFTNNQFAIEFRNVPSGMRLLREGISHPLECNGSSGGQYYYTYAWQTITWSDTTTSQCFYPVNTSNLSLVVDAIVEYPLKESKNYFRDITNAAGIDTLLSNSTIAAGDYNSDGAIDLLISGKLFQNSGISTFTNVTASKGIVNKYSGVSGNAFVDMDNDGDLDIILFGGDTSVLFVNNNGIFTEHILKLPWFKSFLSFSFADINYDGFPDLFVSQLWSTYPVPEPNYLFYNDGNLDFTDQTQRIYPGWDGSFNYPANAGPYDKNRNSRGTQWIDFDNDGDQDLYVVNYFLQQDEFYRNNGDGTFTDICTAKGIDHNNNGANHGTGVDWYDYNNDGYIDLLLPQFAHPRFVGPYDHRGTAIYRNDGPPNYSFTDMVGQYNNYPGCISPIGLQLEETHAGGSWGDVNNDGLADILMTVFYDCRYIDFYEQQPDNTFKIKTFEYGLEHINTGTDVVWVDFDGDGRLDLCGADVGRFCLFKNTYPTAFFVELNLKSTTANKYAIGAKAIVYSGGKKYTQQVCAGRGQKMQKPYTLHYGLGGNSTIDSVVVYWPTNPPKKEIFTGLTAQHIYTLTEGGNVKVAVDQNPDFDKSLTIYPNPAKDMIFINLSLKYKEAVKVEICNTLMQQIAIVFDGKADALPHQYQWLTDGYGNGVYFCRVQVGDDVMVKKFVLVK